MCKKIETKGQRLCSVLVLSLLWGLLAHGFVMLNKFSSNDDIRYLFSAGATISSGRWFLEILSRITGFLLGSPLCSSPLFNGLTSLLLLGLSLWMLYELFEIRSLWAQILLTGVAIATPSVAGLFGYLFTAPFYTMAFALSVAGAYLICRRQEPLPAALGACLIACGVGIYQAYLPAVLCIFLLYFLRWVVSAPEFTGKKALGQMLYYCGMCAAFLGLYFLMSKLFLAVTGGHLTDYNGISQVWEKSLGHYLRQAIYAYCLILRPGETAMYPFGTVIGYYGMLALTAVYAATLLIRTFSANRCRGSLLLLTLLAYPLAVNFIYVMCSETVHVLMLYAHIMLPMLLICLVQLCPIKRGRQAAMVLLACLCLGYVHYDNFCYTRFAFFQERSTNYLNRFVSRIESAPGYDDALPVAYIGEKIGIAETFREMPQFETEWLMPLDSNVAMIDDWDWRIYLHYWCGFSPEEVDPAPFLEDPRVQAMPCYPDDGCIRVIDGIVVVKLEEQ